MNPGNQKETKHSGLLEMIFNTTPNPFVLKDENSVYKRVNQAFCRFLGKTEAEIVGKTDYDLFPASDAEDYVQGDQAVMGGGSQKKEIWEVAGDLGKRWLNVIKTPIIETTGECSGVLCSLTDITPSIEAERETKQQLNLINCLFHITKLTESHNGDRTRLLQDLINCIPPGISPPGSICGRVTMEDTEYTTPVLIFQSQKFSPMISMIVFK